MDCRVSGFLDSGLRSDFGYSGLVFFLVFWIWMVRDLNFEFGISNFWVPRFGIGDPLELEFAGLWISGISIVLEMGISPMSGILDFTWFSVVNF